MRCQIFGGEESGCLRDLLIDNVGKFVEDKFQSLLAI